MKGTGAKRNVCPGSCLSTRAKFLVAPVESAPMLLTSMLPGPSTSEVTTLWCYTYLWLLVVVVVVVVYMYFQHAGL